jgi:hypothetical protein
VATLRAVRPRISTSIPGRDTRFFPDRLGDHTVLCSIGVNRLGREADEAPQTESVLRITGALPSLRHKDNFVCIVIYIYI